MIRKDILVDSRTRASFALTGGVNFVVQTNVGYLYVFFVNASNNPVYIKPSIINQS